MSQQFLSWMTTFIGDPLYRPYRPNEKLPEGGARNEWEAYQAGTEAWFSQGAEAGTKMLKESAQKYRSGMILEGLGLLQLAANDSTNAINTFEQAATVYRDPSDAIRATIHEVFQLKAAGKLKEAIALARKRLEQYPRQPGSEVLKVVEAEMTMAAGGPGGRR
jgi:tetratricopeptide (TPR) repeat protein